MKKKSQWEIFEETPRKYGVYIHTKNGSFAVAEPPKEGSHCWTIDKGRVKAHPIFRCKLAMVEEGTGNFFFNKSLRNYELLEETQEQKRG